MYSKPAVTPEEIVKALGEAVAEKGADFVYQPEDFAGFCNYVHGADGPRPVPGCIVGNVLHRLGVPLGELANYERRDAYSVANALIEIQAPDGGRSIREKLSLIQVEQDDSMPWGEAVAFAGVELPELVAA